MNRVYAINSQSNPLHPEIWPSTTKFDAEVVSMTAAMLSADQAPEEIVGTVSSGGTESILLAMKTYRDWAREIFTATLHDRAPVDGHPLYRPPAGRPDFDRAAQRRH